MKKFFAFIAVCVLSLFTLCSCSSKAETIQTAFENNGYTVQVKESKAENSVLKGLYLISKDIHFSVLFELKSQDDLKAAIDELKSDNFFKIIIEKNGETTDEIVEKITKDGLVNENCIFLTVDDADAQKIFVEA